MDWEKDNGNRQPEPQMIEHSPQVMLIVEPITMEMIRILLDE